MAVVRVGETKQELQKYIKSRMKTQDQHIMQGIHLRKMSAPRNHSSTTLLCVALFWSKQIVYNMHQYPIMTTLLYNSTSYLHY